MYTREILTLQFGHYANYVGTHWWNIQESSFNYGNTNVESELNHDILFREGTTERRQTTYTPRLILVDLKDSLRTLSTEGELYDKPSSSTLPNDVEQIGDEKYELNQFQQDLQDTLTATTALSKVYETLDHEIFSWSDYLYSRFHPRSVNIINQYQHCNENTPFDVFKIGEDLWCKNVGFREEFLDKIRNYLEECDLLQGFHVLTDCTNAFAGFSSSCLEFITDEYDKKSVLVLPAIPSSFNDSDNDNGHLQSIVNDSTRLLNLTLAFDSYHKYSALYAPMCTSKDGWRKPGDKINFNHIDYNHKLPYHSSAILAAALDTATLPYRLKSSGISIGDICNDLKRDDHKVAALSVCLPFSFNSDADFIECLDKWTGPLTKSITPRCELDSTEYVQHLTIRGITEQRLKQRNVNRAKLQKDMPAYKCETVKEMLEYYLTCTTYGAVHRVTSVSDRLSTKTPFPNIFDRFVGINGEIFGESRDTNTKVLSVPMMAGLNYGESGRTMLESLCENARKVNIDKFKQFEVTKDEFYECLENLTTNEDYVL